MRENTKSDSPEYLAKRAFFDKIITIYGRNAVLEALEDDTVSIHKLHFADSNKSAEQLKQMVTLAEKRDIEIAYHDKKMLSRISKNAKQDQGVALDIVLEQALSEEEFLANNTSFRLLALDGVLNPQNLGMIIRSAAAGNIDAILLPTKNAAQISPLVIKASAGTIFKLPIIKTKSLLKSLVSFKRKDAKVYTLSSHAKNDYRETEYTEQTIFVLGNESEGVSQEIEAVSTDSISIPMNREVESLNVAVTASLLAFM